MPVNDHDDLLARADRFAKQGTATDLEVELAKALRAALAARPQPDERIAELELALQLIVNECSGHTFGQPGYDATLDNIHDNAVAALGAPAGSATSVEERE